MSENELVELVAQKMHDEYELSHDCPKWKKLTDLWREEFRLEARAEIAWWREQLKKQQND